MTGAAHLKEVPRLPATPLLIGMLAALVAGLLGAGAAPLYAQATGKAPARAPVKRSLPQQDPLAALLTQAQQAVDRKDLAAALDPLHKYAAQRPQDPYVHFQLGYVFSGLEQWDQARAEFERAIELDPKMAAAHLNLGLVLMDRDATRAAQAFRQAAELQPAESRPRFLAGVVLERSGQLSDAVAEYRKALELSPTDFELNFSLGRALLAGNQAEQAEPRFREAVKLRADSAPALLGLANSLLSQKKTAAGAEALADYLKLKPDDAAARLDRASALNEINRIDEALAELDRMEAVSPPTLEMRKMRGTIYLQQRKWKEAGETLAPALAESPDDPQLLAWLGRVQLQLRDFPNAIRLLGRAYSLDAGSVDALRDLVSAFFLSEDYASTLGAMDRLARLESPQALTWFVRGICYDKLSRKADAIESYQKFLDLDQGHSDTQSFQARRRIVTLQNELKRAGKSR